MSNERRGAFIAILVAAVVLAGGGWWWYRQTEPALSQRIVASVRIEGYVAIGRSVLDGDTGSHPSGNSSGRLFFGPVPRAKVESLVAGVSVAWEPNFVPVPFGDAEMIARGREAHGCTIGVERLERNIPSGFLASASLDQITQFRSGEKDILDIGVVCSG